MWRTRRKNVLQSKQVKRSSHDWINNFIIANLISGIISIIWLLDEWCKIQIKPEFKTRILIGLLLTSSARLAWEFDRCTNLHNLPRLLKGLFIWVRSTELARFPRSRLPTLFFVYLLMCSYEKPGWPGYRDLSFCDRDLGNRDENFTIWTLQPGGRDETF